MTINLNPRLAYLLVTGVVLSTMLLACSNDTDNLLAQVVDDSSEINIIVDDKFSVVPGAVEALDVLKNDTFTDVKEVSITQVSQPSNGNVTVNEDNTIEYSAPESSSEISDTFTYTTQSKNTAGKLTSNTGNVTILVTQDTDSKTVTIDNYLFTPEAKAELKKRFESGYLLFPSIQSDFERVRESVLNFKINPSANRTIWGGNSNMNNSSLMSARQALHHSAFYAYVMDDVSLANIVATEILETVNTNDMNSSYWATNPNFEGQDYLWVQSSEIKKMKDSYHLIAPYQNVLSASDKTIIGTFLDDYAGHVKKWVDTHFDIYWGNDWENIGITTFYGEGLYSETEYSTANPIHDINDNIIPNYTMAGAQNQFNNRIAENISYLHSWAVDEGDSKYENVCREYFKNVIKYGLFSDGTFWELIRNKNTYNINELGVWYSFSTLNALVNMAHLDAMADHFPNDRLYDFETTEGILEGSTNLTPNGGYAASSTTDGFTKKSLKTFIMGQSKYYRNSANGGWNDIRFYNGSPLDMTGNEERCYSTTQAIANLYYKDNDIKDFYSYNTSAGYPAKKTYTDGFFYGDDGNLGTSYIGGAWFEQENNFFN